MTADRLRALAEALPDGASVVLSKAQLFALADGPPDAAPIPDVADSTVEQLAARFERSPSTVRAWCEAGLLPGAYRLRGREWRVPESAVEAFVEQERRGRGDEAECVSSRRPDLGAWRKVRHA